MKNLIYINLVIDQNWAKSSVLSLAFSQKNPETSRISRLGENLALYYFEPQSNFETYCILGIIPDEFWLNHFSQLRNLRNLKFVAIDSHPLYEENWISEFLKKSNNLKFDSATFSGISNLEIKIVEKTKCKIKNIKFNYATFNDKEYLYHFCNEENIIFPESYLVSGEEISILSDPQLEPYLFKSSISSGGSGIFDNAKFKVLLPWIERSGLTQQWKKSIWLKQLRYKINQDYSTFGTTESANSATVLVGYDAKNLSLEHGFGHNIESQIQDKIDTTFEKVRLRLINEGYNGPFGFDSFITSDGTFFPIIDLNVRLTKTHLLAAAIDFWKPNFKLSVCVRIQFQNRRRSRFQDFWSEFTKKCSINFYGENSSVQVIPIEVSCWLYDICESSWIISGKDEESILNTRRILQKCFSELSSGNDQC